jgi:hypothetical protein
MDTPAYVESTMTPAETNVSRKSGLGRYHGSAFDRGGADSWYGRAREPHFWPDGTYYGTMVSEAEMTPEEIAEYHLGYDDNEKFGGKRNTDMSKAQTDIRRTSYDAATVNPNGYVGTLEDALAQINAELEIQPFPISARTEMLMFLNVPMQSAADTEDDSVEYRDPPPPVSLHDQGIGARLDALNDQQMEVYWAARVRVGIREALAYAEAYPYPAVRQ